MSLIKKISIGLGVIIVLIGVGIWLAWGTVRLVWPYIVQPEIAIAGEIEKVTITGDTAGEQTFFVYLPAGYESGDQDYRTLYHLHGAGVQESWAGYDCNGIGEGVEKAVADGVIEPMIVVCPVDPGADSMWADSFDGQHLISSGIRQDIIPYVEANYRAVTGRNGRALQGFSMGGFGAAMNGFKYHEDFNAIIIWDGALHDWNTLTTSRANIVEKMFATEEYFDEWSAFEWTERSADVDIDLFMVVGTMEATNDFASRYRPHLENVGRDVVFYDSTCPHSIFCMTDELGTEAFAFLAESFDQ